MNLKLLHRDLHVLIDSAKTRRRRAWTVIAEHRKIAAAAALGGVALEALVEPLKLRAARRVRVWQDRAERCAKLTEAAMSCRARLLSLNLAHRQVAADEPLEGNSEEDRLDLYRTVCNDLRQTVALIKLSGPDELADAAMAVRQAERQFRTARFASDDNEHFNRDVPPKAVLDGAQAWNRQYMTSQFSLASMSPNSPDLAIAQIAGPDLKPALPP